MGPDLAKRDSLGIVADSSSVKRNAAQLDHKLSGKESPADDSKIAGHIETLVLQKSAAKPITLGRLVRELSSELPYSSDKIISKITILQADRKIVIREPIPYKRFLDYLLSPTSIW